MFDCFIVYRSREKDYPLVGFTWAIQFQFAPPVKKSSQRSAIGSFKYSAGDLTHRMGLLPRGAAKGLVISTAPVQF